MHVRTMMRDRWAKGTVRWAYVNLRTGERRQVGERSNVITYTAADLMARMLGGQTDYVPKYFGFIYGTNAAPGLVDPDTLPASTRRVHPWSQIASDLAGVAAGKANCVISAMTTQPAVSLGVDSDPALYANNAVTLAANTGSRLEYGFSISGGIYAPALQDDGVSDYMYQAVLLARIVAASGITYYPFARISLADAGVYSIKPANWELALDWTVTYF